MSIQPIVTVLKQLIKAHELLLEITMDKTEHIKEGNVDDLQTTLYKEQKATQTVQKLDGKRELEVELWFKHQKLSIENATITKILDHLPHGEEKQNLEIVTTQLTHLIIKIKQQEQLNQALLQQSMQFVQLSLSMLQPSIENFNYNQKQMSSAEKHSVFDSKA